jgi:hypothetical protein
VGVHIPALQQQQPGQCKQRQQQPGCCRQHQERARGQGLPALRRLAGPPSA